MSMRDLFSISIEPTIRKDKNEIFLGVLLKKSGKQFLKNRNLTLVQFTVCNHMN